MPPAKGKKGKAGNSKKTKNNRPPDPTLDCIFPREIISNILSRLPVKDLLKFRCVCKPWKKLISKPHFVQTHLQFRRSSSLVGSSDILIASRHAESSDHLVSIYKTGEGVEELDNPYPVFFPNMFVVGPCNGIFCLFQPPDGDTITLWNPAMRYSRLVPLSKTKRDRCWIVSVALAFDPQEIDNLFILRIFSAGMSTTVPNQLEICSTKTNFSWKKLKNEVVFDVVSYTCMIIVKGAPYWWCLLKDELFGVRQVLVRFDLGKKVFEKLPIPHELGKPVNLEDSLGMLIWKEERKELVDVWVMDDEDVWSKKWTVGPLSGVDRTPSCLNNGDIVAENENGELLLFDRVTNSVKSKFRIDNAKNGSYVIFDYSESLLLITGMLPVKKQDSRDRKNITRHLMDYMDFAADKEVRW